MEFDPTSRNRDKESFSKPGYYVEFVDKGDVIRVNIGEINEAFANVNQHNRKFSIEGKLTNVFLSLPMEGDKNTKPHINPGSEDEYRQMSASGIEVMHASTLHNTGLVLDENPDRTGSMVGNGERTEIGRLLIGIDDTERFLHFLQALQPNQIKDRELGMHLGCLSTSVIQKIIENYQKKDTETQNVQYITDYEDIVIEFARLGLGEAVSAILPYLNHAKKGDLQEFTLVEQYGLLHIPGIGNGPADWQRDSTEELLVGRWKNAINSLSMMRSNPNAQDMFEEVRSHLILCAALARESLPSIKDISEERRNNFKNILSDVSNILRTNF